MSVNTYNSSLNKLINIAGGGEGANFKAMYDKTTALYAHAIDDIIYVDNHFYKVTSAIAIGDTIAVGTNVEEAELSSDMAIYIENLPSAEGGFSADQVGYDNTTSGLTADNVQDAIDELKSDIPASSDPQEDEIETSFSADGKTITEVFSTGTKTTVFNNNGTITETYPDGRSFLTTFNNDGSISKEEITS